MSQPKFHLGDIVVNEINDEMIQCTIVPFPNGVIAIHIYNLEEAYEVDYSGMYGVNTNDPNDRSTSDGQIYAMSDFLAYSSELILSVLF